MYLVLLVLRDEGMIYDLPNGDCTCTIYTWNHAYIGALNTRPIVPDLLIGAYRVQERWAQCIDLSIMTKIISDAHMEAFENMERAGARYGRILIIASRNTHCQYSKPCR
jgi:hypothetical protein